MSADPARWAPASGDLDGSGVRIGGGLATRVRRRYWILIALAAIVLGALAWVGLTPLSPELREEVHVIPKGTWARRSVGEDVLILPSRINLTLGIKDILVLINDDDVPQLFGPVLMMPGQSFRLPFNVASEYQFACTAHASGYLTVVVEPAPSWWKLFLARAAGYVKPAA